MRYFGVFGVSPSVSPETLTLSILLAFITLQGLSSRRTINYKALRLPAVLTLRLNIDPAAVHVQCNSYKYFFATD